MHFYENLLYFLEKRADFGHGATFMAICSSEFSFFYKIRKIKFFEGGGNKVN